MKHYVCIALVGSFNLCELVCPSFTKMRQLLERLNYEYDIYINISNEINIKDIHENDVTNLKNKLRIDGLKYLFVKGAGTHVYYTYKDVQAVKELMETVFSTSTIKSLHIENDDNGISSTYYSCGCVHMLPDYFYTKPFNRYKQISICDEFISNKSKYTLYIHMRPDTYIKDFVKLDKILRDIPDKDIFYSTCRKDYFVISNKYITEIINEDIFEQHKDAFFSDKQIQRCKYTSPGQKMHFELNDRAIFSILKYEMINMDNTATSCKYDFNYEEWCHLYPVDA